MNPLAAGLRQPDARSCGAASVVMARLVRDAVTPTPAAFRREVLDCHRRLTAPRDAGRWQVPWPRAIGTPPWAVRHELESVTGHAHEVHVARWSRAAAYDRLATAGGALYVGSRTLPRHVLLVLPPVGDADDGLCCYQPSRGTVEVLTRDEFVGARLRSAGWPYPWLLVTPAG
ncbi:hypothetical protein [Nocardioides rubriscoriae]|uniref:hypothetical protein n=1 Tax=Nocardioides rubriscoriae TaxID=642762 RepID=UPI0011DF1DAE|nr:hypothetical protein [Nocardioides rubriscoriae]